MLNNLLKSILRKPIAILAAKFSSRPVKELVHKALTELFYTISESPGKKGHVLRFSASDRFIIFSDQHKGVRNGADIFSLSEKSYVAALNYYYENNYFLINLGDCEELWGNTVDSIKKYNILSFEKEKLFAASDRFLKIFGNHDLYWDNDPLASLNLEDIYGKKIKIYEGAILQTEIGGKALCIFLTHGHQGDLQSDGNWFSKWFISNIWGPLQMYLNINLNTPSVDDHLKSLHNKFMYDWSVQQKDLLLITGHTHQPVFESLTHLERLYRQLAHADKNNQEYIHKLEGQIRALIKKGDANPDFNLYKPTYFNSGCCCFNDGDISGIEIADGYIRLIKWEYESDTLPVRKVLEESALSNFID